MKHLFYTITFSCGFAIAGNSQVNESFFERLGPQYTSISNKESYGYCGTKTQSGALAVRLADSLDTEVQWVKTDLHGNYEFFSGNLPTNTISPNEKIIQLFEYGDKQYIVTNDSLSYAPRGIRIHKFENYTQNAGYFEFPTSFLWKNSQAYFRNGKIYVFFTTQSHQFKRLTIDPVSMTLENELILASNYSYTESFNSFFKSIHVDFHTGGDMTVYSNASTQLARINVVNNVSTVEFREMRLKKVLGIDTVNHKLICLKNYAGNDLYRYELNAAVPLANIQALDSIQLPGNTPQSLKDWAYVTDGSTEFLLNNEGFFRYLTISNNQITAQDSIYSINKVTNLDLINGKPIAFGVRADNYASAELNANSQFLFIAHGTLDQLFKFREYYGIYPFGDQNTRFGTGNCLITPLQLSAVGDFIFNRQIFYLGQSFVGKQDGQIKGYFNQAYAQYYKPGPYTQLNKYSQEIVHKYNENFYVDLAMLNHHVASIGNPGYVIPNGILNWPAHGNVTAGQAANLAPFMDLNNDGIYEPTAGEYPVFPGTRCLLNITHQHESDFNNMGSGLELHTYMYRFDCEDSISDVIFLKTEVYNRGNTDYDSLAAGLMADFDLGGPFDDYVGTHVENGLIYSYNGDNFDGEYQGIQGFNDSLPTIGVLLLQGVKLPVNNQDDAAGIGTNQTVNGMGFSDGTIDNEYKGLEYSIYYTNGSGPETADPTAAAQWYNVMNGKLRFGDSLLYGDTHIPSRYIFADDSDPLMYGTYGIDPGFNWSEGQTAQGQGSNPPGDRRIMGSFGSAPLASGNQITYHSAILAGKRVPGQAQSQLDLFAKASHVRSAFDQNLTSCGQTFGNTTEDQVTSIAENEKVLDFNVYPNPFSDEIYISVLLQDENTSLQLIDINGKVMLNEKLSSSKSMINLSAVQKGVYFLKVENSSGSATKMIVKQ